MEAIPSISFPVIRGLQAKREYYVAMWTLRILKKISIFDEDELPPEMRAQRTLNRGRIPEMSNYVLDNPGDYTFSALTVSIDSEVRFDPFEANDKLGVLHVPMEARFIINDGQHRRAAIMAALEERPELAHETIAVVFFLDVGLDRSQQMFADLNRHAIRPSRSLGLLYDHRNEKAKLAKLVIFESTLFREIVEKEKSSLSARSRKLFTLSAFYNACAELVQDIATGDLVKDANIARAYWEEVAKQFPSWGQVREGALSAGEIREDFIHTHGIALQALARAGNRLLQDHPKDWKKRLKKLADIDWSRSNPDWEGRAMQLGALQKKTTNVQLTANAIKAALGLKLSPEEQELEKAFKKSR